MAFPLYCLPGLGSSAAAFDDLAKLLPQQEIIAVDFAGQGHRLHDAYQGDPLIFAAEELQKRIQANGHQQFGLIGHSMGGAVAMLIAQAMPKKTAALISIEGNLIEEDCGVASRKLAGAKDFHQVEIVKQSIIEAVISLPKPGWPLWAHDFARVTPKVLQDYAISLFELSKSGILLEIFQHFNGPKCYLYGDEYIDHPILSQLQTIPAHHIKKADHFVMQDQPTACAKIISTLLNG